MPKLSKILNALLKYLFAALLFFVPLYPKFPFLNVPGTYVAIRAEDFLIASLGFALCLSFFHPTLRRLLLRSPFTPFFLTYILIGFLSTLAGVFLTKTAPLHLSLLHWGRRIEYILPFFVALLLGRDEKNLRFYLKLILPIALVVFFYGLAQLYFNAPVISTQNEEFSKGFALTLQPGVNLSSTFAGHYDLAVYLMLTITLGTALLFAYRHRLLKPLHLLTLLALFWLMLQTGSRMGFLALIVSTSLVLFLLSQKRFIPIILLLAFVGAANTPSLSGRFFSFLNIFRVETIQEKVKGVFDIRSLIVTPAFAAEPAAPPSNETLPLRPIQQDRSTSIRLDVEWPRALRAFLKNPFLGTGYASISLATDNDYLRALGETGLLGFLAFFSLLVYLFASLVATFRNSQGLKRTFAAGVLASFVGFLLIAVFLDVFESSKPALLFWMYTGLATSPNSHSRS